MTRPARIRLGFEVGTGKPVDIPLLHMVVTGQTQQAGKTTTMEALIHRARLPAIAFITKRGEKSFSESHRLQPYFRERADWQFVSSVLEATLREKMKFERAWIIKVSKGAKTLSDVQRNVRDALKKASGISEGVYTTLDAYLDIVVPRIARLTFAKQIEPKAGVNVMDLSDRDSFPPELQALVMRSALEWVYEKCDGTITIIPEAWEFLPQMRGSPVKLAAEELIRKGAGLHNFVWLDSQDIGGIDKMILRQCPVWLLGKQREANEIKRTLENIPKSVKKPKPEQLATLKLGQFYACFDEHVICTYVWPSWMAEQDAIDIAKGSHELRDSAVVVERIAESLGVTPEPVPYSASREATLETVRREGYEKGYREGFDKGYEAASATLHGQLTGVINAASNFMGELRDMSHKLAQTAAEGVSCAPQPPTAPVPRQIADVVSILDGGKKRAKKAGGDSAAKTCADKLLAAIGRVRRPISWAQACAIARMAPPDNGYFYGGRKYLLEHNLVQESDDLVKLTQEGRQAAGKPKPPTLAELLDQWIPHLKKPGGDLLQVLARRPSDWMTTAELAAAAKVKPGNGYWYGGVKALVRHGLAEQSGDQLRLTELLREAAAL